MLKTFYELFGFFGALSISLALFFFFIFWLAGLAGITLPVDGGKPKFNKWQVLLSIFIPLYPLYCLIRKIPEQHSFLSKI